MKITRTSPLSGKELTKEIPVTQYQLNCWEQGALIQDAMLNISEDDREFIMTGLTSEEWDETFAKRCVQCNGKTRVIDYDTGVCPKCLDPKIRDIHDLDKPIEDDDTPF